MVRSRGAGVGALLVAGCAASQPTVTDRPGGKELIAVRSFDLVPRGHDDNGLALNPQLGWSYNRSCAPQAPISRQSQDPTACSWHFLENNRATKERPSCTTDPMDPDFSTDLSSKLAITCSDSPLSFTGHLNWGKAHGGAVTYDGWIEWEGFSGEWPGDHDLNFILTLERQSELGDAWNWVKVELDYHELRGIVGSTWWKELMQKVELDKLKVGAHVGTARARVTGLLGIDAEHMSLRDPSIELHPAYAMALRVPCDDCPANTERWALLARAQGNEGFCSHWDRKHVMALLNGAHTFRIPWNEGMTGVKVDVDQTQFCSSGAVTSKVLVRPDSNRAGVLVTVPLTQEDVVDGELYLHWTGSSAKTDVAPKRAPMRMNTHELEDPVVAQRRIDALSNHPSEGPALMEAADERNQLTSCRRLMVSQEPVTIEPPPPQKPCSLRSVVTDVRRAVGTGGPAPKAPAGSARLKKQPSIVDTYCEKRARKSAAAAKFCAERPKPP
jgi:hypothetical protein